jgi:hypothetical protein
MVLAVATVAMTGCAGFETGQTGAPVTPVPLVQMKGLAHGGQNPISGAVVQLYQAGSAGYGAGATALIPTGSYYLGGATGCVASGSQVCYQNVVTDANGNFNLTGLYSCTSGTQVYLTATGGNTGSGVNNASMIMAALGLCDNVPSIPFILANEVTTVGAVWALSPFMSDSYNAATQTGYVNIGAPATNQAGMVQAFADINTLVSYANGSSPGEAAAASGATVPVSEIYAIANSLASCINSNGTGVCQTLFGYTTVNGTAPTDAVGAAIHMARYPAQNAGNIISLGTSQAPFPSTFSTGTVNDLTLAVTYTGSGLSSPSGVAVDAGGNVWVSNAGNNSVSEFANSGVALSGTSGYTAGSMSSPSAIAIDTAGHAWIANAGSSTLTELGPTGANVGSSPFSGGGLSGPASVSFDGLGNIWVANYSNSSVSEFSSAGTAISGTSGYTATGLTGPIGVAINPR